MRTAAILRRVTLAAGYAVMPFLLTDALHPPQCLSSGVVLYGYTALALFLAAEKKRGWMRRIPVPFLFSSLRCLFLPAENFSMSRRRPARNGCGGASTRMYSGRRMPEQRLRSLRHRQERFSRTLPAKEGPAYGS